VSPGRPTASKEGRIEPQPFTTSVGGTTSYKAPSAARAHRNGSSVSLALPTLMSPHTRRRELRSHGPASGLTLENTARSIATARALSAYARNLAVLGLAMRSSTPRAPRSRPRITRLCSISGRVLGNRSREPWLGHPSTRAIHCPAEHLGSAVQWRTRRSTAGSARRESGSCKRDDGGSFHPDRNFRLFGEALRRAAFRDAPLCTKR
jgi:hypothetical protein